MTKQQITIIAATQQETEELQNICKFLPIKETTLNSVVMPSEPLPQTFPEQDIVFASLAAFRAFNIVKPSTTIYLNKELAILEISESSQALHHLCSEYRLCYLLNETSLQLLSGADKTAVFHNLIHFLESRQPTDMLVTANHNLVLSLLLQANEPWQIIHPEIPALNLAMDIPNCTDIRSTIHYLLDSKQISEPYESKISSLIHPTNLKKSQEHAYSFFADLYDDYMSHVDYNTWITRLLTWHKTYSNQPLRRVLELACGTANISIRLVQKGLQVDACDLSYDMLRVANSKPLKPNLYRAALTDTIPEKDYNLILCMFDSINYLTKPSEIVTLLYEVHKALSDNGLFIFDISTLYNSEENFADICSLQRSQDAYLVHQAWFETTQMLQKSSLHYFKKHYLGYKHQHEQHTQKVYHCADLIDLMAKTPLKLVAIHTVENRLNYYPRHLSSIDDKFARLFFILKKETK